MAENADLKLKIHLKEGGEKLAGIYFLVNLALFAHPRDLYIYILISSPSISKGNETKNCLSCYKVVTYL